MSALIPELVNMASDPTVMTADLLRRALVASRRLLLSGDTNWITQELHGYVKVEDVPDYRIITGQLSAYSQRHGLRDLNVTSAVHAEPLSMCPLVQAIGEVESWLLEEDSMVTISFPPEQEDAIKRQLPMGVKPVRRFALSHVRGVVDAVRNRVLCWALDLEVNGVVGEGMSFTPQEQLQAQQLIIQINGNVHGSQLMVSSPGSQQQQNAPNPQKSEALAALQPWLQQEPNAGELRPETYSELLADLDTLKAQATSPKPKWLVIGAVASNALTILEETSSDILPPEAIILLRTLKGS
ncbi:hypothetical protein ACET92_07600 [Aeromonas veronii]